MKRKLCSVFSLLVVLLLGGCMIQPVNAPLGSASVSMDGADAVAAGTEAISAYMLKPLDPIYIRFSGIMEQQQLELVIDENGEISLLHLVDPIQAAGLTTSMTLIGSSAACARLYPAHAASSTIGKRAAESIVGHDDRRHNPVIDTRKARPRNNAASSAMDHGRLLPSGTLAQPRNISNANNT